MSARSALITIPCTRAIRAVACLALAACACTAPPATLDLATTTSVQNSGLLEQLLPAFREAEVRVHAAGSGRALEMLSDGIVDAVISHAPGTEARYLAEHPDWVYRKVAFNRFVIVGPLRDPAGVRDATGAADAFARVATSAASFVSRGDGSGTHEREQTLWSAAGETPSPDRLLISGRGMALTLRHAQERQAYTLSDEATFWQLRPQLDLEILFSGDPVLLNTYAVIYAADAAMSGRFAEWLTHGDGRQRIERYRVDGRAVFSVWPSGCADALPAATPC